MAKVQRGDDAVADAQRGRRRPERLGRTRLAGEQRHGVALSSLDDELFAGAGATKRDLLDHLEAVADVMLPGLVDRPLSVIRVRPGQPAFMQKNLPAYAPASIRRVPQWSEASHREVSYAVVEDVAALVWFGNQRAVEYHVPLFRLAEPDRPTALVLDLDPPEGTGFDVVVAAARVVRQALDDTGLVGAVKTSGSKGVHVVVPLTPTATFDAAAATRALAARAERLDPELTTTAYLRRTARARCSSTRPAPAAGPWPRSTARGCGRARRSRSRWAGTTWTRRRRRTSPSGGARAARHAAELGGAAARAAGAARGPVAEGHEIPSPGCAAMHEGKRRKRAREAGAGEG